MYNNSNDQSKQEINSFSNFRLELNKTVSYRYSSEERESFIEIIKILKKLEDEITIEYYNNSGIVKTIDGINKFDYDKLKERIKYLENEKEKELEQERIEAKEKKAEEERLEKEEQELNLAIYKIKENAIGKDIEDVKGELEKIGISDCSIKYISSKLYEVGTVAFADREEGSLIEGNFYVVEDNDNEDMIEMPEIEEGMTQEEVKDILKESGLNYRLDTFSSEYDKEKSGTLRSYQYSPGTLLPIGLEVWISFYE